MKRIFLLGSERSGSNLLRMLLGNHSEVSAPIALHLCDVFYQRINLYYPFDNENLRNLYADIQRYINHEFNEWSMKIDFEYMLEVYRPQNFIQVLDSIYSEKARSSSASAYFVKDNHIHKYAMGIKSSFSDSKFIYLYRDPRDQVASWLRSPVHLHTCYKAIRKWNNEQNECLKLKQFYNIEMFEVKYEDLVDNTVKVMSELLQFLDLEVQSACFSTNEDNFDALKHPLWKNLNKPVIKGNYGKYEDVLGKRDLEMIETLSAPVMRELGYSRVTKGQWRPISSYSFKLSEMFTERYSRWRNRNFVRKEMRVLVDKQNLINEIFNRRKRL